MSRDLHLITIWARHDGAYDPQFVAALPVGLADGMPELYNEWREAACAQYRDEVDSPIIAFYSGSATIERPEGFDGLMVSEVDGAGRVDLGPERLRVVDAPDGGLDVVADEAPDGGSMSIDEAEGQGRR